MTDLLPCPFCGEAELTLTTNRSGWKIVECDGCGMRGPCIDLDGDQYLDRWNMRPPRSEVQSETPARAEMSNLNDPERALVERCKSEGFQSSAGCNLVDLVRRAGLTLSFRAAQASVDPAVWVKGLLDLYFAPWGAAKAARFEEMTGYKPFDPEVVLKLIHDKLKGSELPSASRGTEA